jgi:DNA-binding protein H-NS
MASKKLDELQQQIESLQKEREELLNTERAEAIETAKELIRTFRLTVRDLNLDAIERATAKAPRPKVPMKYRLDGDAWSGRGRKPKWVEDHLKRGGTLDELLVK